MDAYKRVLERQSVRDALLRFNGNYFNWQNGIPFLRLKKIKNTVPVGAFVESRLAGVLSRNTSIDGAAADEKVLETVNKAISGLVVGNITASAFDAVLYGLCIASVTWTVRDGIYSPEKVEFLSIDGWSVNKDGVLEFAGTSKNKIKINDENRFVLIPAFRKRGAYSPMGEGILNNLFWHTQYLEAGLEFWVEFAEKYGSPFLAAKTRPNADITELSLIDKMLSAIRKAGWMRIPQGTDLQFLEASGKGASADVYKGLLSYIREDIALEVLGHTGAAISTAGKLGNENSAMSVREDMVDLDCSVIEAFFNELIDRIITLNFGKSAPVRFVFLPKEDFQKDLADRDKKVYEMGIDIAPEYFAQKYGIPLEFLSQRQRPADFTELSRSRANFAGDVLHHDAGGDFSRQGSDYFGFTSLVEQVEEILSQSSSYEEAKEKIIDKFGNLDDTYLADVLQNAKIMSELSGRSSRK